MFTFLKDIQCLQTNHVLASCQQARTEELCSSLFADELEYYGAQTQTESETEQTEMHKFPVIPVLWQPWIFFYNVTS